MLITALLPLLARYSLGFDLVAGKDDLVTLTIIPRKSEAAKGSADPTEFRPIAITATAVEIDAELALGEAGALGQMFAARKSLGDQLAEHRAAAEAAKTAASSKVKPAAKASEAKPVAPTPALEAAPAASGEPVSLY